jgi:hypothetical protein
MVKVKQFRVSDADDDNVSRLMCLDQTQEMGSYSIQGMVVACDMVGDNARARC